MKGNNELRLNDATMMEALQEYFDKRITGSLVDVKSIKCESQGYAGNTFIVQVAERPAVGKESAHGK